MPRRGTNNFTRNDLRRAIRGARESGINPTMVEIEGRDGTRFRVFGDRAPEVLNAREQAAAHPLGPQTRVIPGKPDAPSRLTRREANRGQS